MNNGFTNELYDIAAAGADVMGFDVPHVEALVREEASEDTLFVQVTNNAFVGGASIEEAGARVWLMGRSLGLSMRSLTLTAGDKTMLRQVARESSSWLLLLTGGVPMERRMAVMEMLCGRVMDQPGRESVLWKLGRRVSLLAYALNRGVIIREALESFAVIGEKWELTAKNKRSAVSAAMNALRAEMMRTGHLPDGFRFWFEKSEEARLVYAQVQVGNGNRLRGMTNEEGPGDGRWEMGDGQSEDEEGGCCE